MAASKKVLALDYGKVRVGYAVGSTDLKIAVPKGVFVNKGITNLVGHLMAFIFEQGIDLVVVGLPLGEEGEDSGFLVPDIRYFAQELDRRLKSENRDVEVYLLDEHLSSFEADGLMDDVSRQGLNANLERDAFAAQIILQRFFDRI